MNKVYHLYAMDAQGGLIAVDTAFSEAELKRKLDLWLMSPAARHGFAYNTFLTFEKVGG